ncbi:MAG: hypothetical protein HN929_02230 [Chloroflexi bacterium]|nr:hypothetical protein [Chloroflexota bacterium]
MFDKNKPYGEVFGMPGVRYVQDGANYSADGVLVTENSDDAGGESVDESGELDYESMSWHQLKKIVVAAGGEYEGKEEAIDFLSNLDEAAD